MIVENTPSNRTNCQVCKNKIPKNTLRMKVITNSYNGHNNYRYFCAECGAIYIDQQIKFMIDEKKRLEASFGNIER